MMLDLRPGFHGRFYRAVRSELSGNNIRVMVEELYAPGETIDESYDLTIITSVYTTHQWRWRLIYTGPIQAGQEERDKWVAGLRKQEGADDYEKTYKLPA